MITLDVLARLAGLLGKLPGVGRRSAERMAMKLARDTGGLVRSLVLALEEVEAKVCTCSLCGNVTLQTENPCRLCGDPRRDAAMLCVVEDPADIQLIEAAGVFRGRYHALMGKLSPLRGEGPRDLRVDLLLKRIRKEGTREVLLALDSDVESDATASFLRDLLAGRGVQVSRLALGLPAGSAVAYSDPVTLARAIEGRRPF
jgi:recombination protein RecR